MSNYYSLINSVSPYLANLIAYYPFNSNANDFSGNSYNGTILSTPVTFPAGKVGNAINFPNNNNATGVEIPDNNDFSFTDNTNDLPFTISMWANVSNFSSSTNYLFYKVATSNFEYRLSINASGTITFVKSNQLFTAYQTITSASGTITTGVWNHIVITNLSSNIAGVNIYLNGTLLTVTRVTTGTYLKMINGTALPTFALGASTTKHRGSIDEAYIWKNRELNATEVLDIYNKGNSGQTLI
jgi:hypothetical protein